MKKVFHIINLIRAFVFIIIGGLLLITLDRVFLPKWSYPQAYNTSYQMETFWNLPNNTNEVLFLGTSHMMCGISPVEIYEKNGIVSYNLGTASQPIQGTYYLLKEAFKYQSPKVIVLDVSNLFYPRTDDFAWEYIFHNLPEGVNKGECVTSYISRRKYEDAESERITTGESNKFEQFVNNYFTALRFHERWKEICEEDFATALNKKTYYSAGQLVATDYVKCNFSVKEMNEHAENLHANQQECTVEYTDGCIIWNVEDDSLCDPEISPNNIDWLRRIDKLCDENGAKLLLTKIPAVDVPNLYPGAWTEKRYECVKQLAEECGYTYVDWMYEENARIDLNTDYWDGGHHLNYLGAVKMSSAMGKYLDDNYKLKKEASEQYELLAQKYAEMTIYAKLQTETNFHKYMKILNDQKENVIVCVTANDDIANGLSKSAVKTLKQLGLLTKIEEIPAFGDTYLAVIDGGEVKFERLSNRRQTKEIKLGKLDIEMVSAGSSTGAYTENHSKIIVDGEDRAINQRGLNIVVIDKTTSCVVDSVCFDTYEEEPYKCAHRDATRNIQEYMLKMP